MKFPVFQLTAVAAVLAIGGNANAALPNGIAAGDVSQTSAVLWGRSDAIGDLNFQYATDSAFTQNVGYTFKPK